MVSVFVDVFKSLFVVAWDLLKLPLLIVACFLGLFALLCLGNYLYLRCVKKLKKPTGVHYRLRKRNFFQKLFIDAPRQFAYDYISRSPEFFRYQGMIIYTGRQGRGKTVALAEHTRRMQREYPKCKVIGNLDYKYQDDVLDHWTKLIDYKNGIQGVVCQIDETQNWFSSNQSKDFPPEMLEVITQNRKNRRIILGTAQSFNRLAKPIREQTTEVRECHTFAGCVTFVIRKEPFLDFDGNVEKLKYRGCYFFVHNAELRNSYDTYKVIDSLRKSGFKEQVPVINNTTKLLMDKKSLKKMR